MWRRGRIVSHRKSWGEAAEFDVAVEGQEELARGLAYVPMVGMPEVDDEVLLSASAVARGLGTGGYMMIVAIPARLPADPPPAPGHLVKARYTPMQYMVEGVDEQESEFHEALEDASCIDGMPVVVADLHSAVPAILAGIHDVKPDAKIAYVMTDGGALPAWFSQMIVTLREGGHILGTITCGQAFGGELEAVNVHTALLAARIVWDADVAVVAQGPGNLGTGTRWGFSGVAAGEAINAVSVLHGRPVACLRISNADKRDRHYGISHHSMRILRDVVTVPCDVVIPVPPDGNPLSQGIGKDVCDAIAHQVFELDAENLNLVEVSTEGLMEVLAAPPAPLRTMGRGFDEDPLAFLSAAAAGRFAARMLG